MKNILTELAERPSMKSAIQANWEAYHYCLAQSPNVELARTITDLAKSEEIPSVHLAEALHASQPSEDHDGLKNEALAKLFLDV